jgi:hypothetical protein
MDDHQRDKRLTLAFVWTWVMFNYVYGDILKIFTIFTRPDLQLQLEAGTLGGIPLNNMSTFVMAAAMELAIVMVFLSWKLPYRPNRILNILLGLFFTLVMGAILFGAGRVPPLSGYTLYGLLEMATTLAIAWIAWRWRPPAAETAG